MQKKILILGAGVYQVPLILKAKEMGLYTIAASYAGPYPGLAIADEVWEIDTTDYHALLEKAEAAQISGVCTTGTDVSVISVGYLCEKLHLQGIPFSAARLATNKASMKEAFLSGGVSTPKAYKVFTDAEALDAFSRLKPPVIVKAVDSSGSRGITIVNEPSGLREAYHNALDRSRKEYVLVEEKLEGTEIGVDGMVQGGELVFLAPHEKFVYHTDKITIPAGHGFPYLGSERLQKEIEKQMRLAVKALGLDNCSVNADVFVDNEKGKAWIIEMGGRTGATCIPELISMYYGFDFYEKILQNALGQPVGFTPEKEGVPCMAKLLMSPVDGIITEINERKLERMREKGIAIKLDFPVGHAVEAMQNGTTRIGQVVMEADCVEQLDQTISRVYHCIKVDGTSLEELWKR